MNTAQSKEEFVTALHDYKKIINKGLAVARQKAFATPIAPGGAPGGGQTQGGAAVDPTDPYGIR